jgi:hypothetical protein
VFNYYICTVLPISGFGERQNKRQASRPSGPASKEALKRGIQAAGFLYLSKEFRFQLRVLRHTR